MEQIEAVQGFIMDDTMAGRANTKDSGESIWNLNPKSRIMFQGWVPWSQLNAYCKDQGPHKVETIIVLIILQ